jgi:hypothetical protein
MKQSSFICFYAASWTAGVLLLGLTGCATVSVTPGNIERPDPAVAYNAIEAEPVMPAQIAVADFDFVPSSVIENRSGFHRALDFFLGNSSAQQRQTAIGRKAATVLSDKTAQRLGKTGLQVTRIPSGSDVPLPADSLLVTGRLLEVNEGNCFTRVTFGFGLGESHLVSEVRVYRVVNREQAEVLAFTTHANSGKMPGIAASLAFGYFLIGPITIITVVEDAVSSGQKIYVSQIDYLAAQTGDQVARYLSQYAAQQRWISQEKARRAHFADSAMQPEGTSGFLAQFLSRISGTQFRSPQ